MARTYGKRLIAPTVSVPDAQKFVESVVNKGMFTVADPADIPSAGLTLGKNVRCRYDRTMRRFGRASTNLPTAPNANKILRTFMFKKNDGTLNWLRFTRNSIHRRGATLWTAFTPGVGGSLTGGDNDRFSLAVVLNKLFAANGVDRVQEIDTTTTQYKVASATATSAPKARYVTGFFNRVVAAHDTDVGIPNGPVTVTWSADGDSTLWPADTTPDESSGTSPIVESPSDLADFITGVFGFTSVLILLREKSIWLASKQPIASNPFYFAAAVPGIGCDCPHSAAVIPNGIVFADTHTSTVWAYQAGSQPERIGLSVEADIIKSIDNPDDIFSGYNSRDNEYMLGIPVISSNIIRTWTYNFRAQAWTYDEAPLLSSIEYIDSEFNVALSFDELVGTFDGLTGTFDQLGAVTAESRPTLTFGRTDGIITEEIPSLDNDETVGYESEIQSKDFVFPQIDMYLSELRLEFLISVASTITIEYSKDSGITWKPAKIIQLNISKKPQLVRFLRQVKTRRLRWRVRSSNGVWDLLGFEVHVFPGPQSRK